MDELQNLQENYPNDLKNSNSLAKLDAIKTKYLGRKGLINKLLQNIKNLSSDEKKQYGSQLNNLKIEIAKSLNEKKQQILTSENKEWIDVTLPGSAMPRGSLHPITLTIEKITQIFGKLSFNRVSYPEVEWEYFSFEALNMPENHPARDDFETIFIEAPKSDKYGQMILSPHTSSGQVREMLEAKKPPIRMINIAKCYRPNWDATHNPMFYQFEGLCIDQNINITHLKGTIDFFVKEFFGENREIRLRPYHFQFTEPSFETDISCEICLGKGVSNGKKCTVCKSGWLELGGAGMVHPHVLKAGGIDPVKYSGWAFGFGPERCLMMKIGLNDMRNLYSGDIRFLE